MQRPLFLYCYTSYKPDIIDIDRFLVQPYFMQTRKYKDRQIFSSNSVELYTNQRCIELSIQFCSTLYITNQRIQRCTLYRAFYLVLQYFIHYKLENITICTVQSFLSSSAVLFTSQTREYNDVHCTQLSIQFCSTLYITNQRIQRCTLYRALFLVLQYFIHYTLENTTMYTVQSFISSSAVPYTLQTREYNDVHCTELYIQFCSTLYITHSRIQRCTLYRAFYLVLQYFIHHKLENITMYTVQSFLSSSEVLCTLHTRDYNDVHCTQLSVQF